MHSSNLSRARVIEHCSARDTLMRCAHCIRDREASSLSGITFEELSSSTVAFALTIFCFHQMPLNDSGDAKLIVARERRRSRQITRQS